MTETEQEQRDQDENKSVSAAPAGVASPTRQDSSVLSPLFGPDDHDIESKINGRCCESTTRTSANATPSCSRSSRMANGNMQNLHDEAKKGEQIARDEEANENLLAGFTLLRLVQLLNLDVYYIEPAASTLGKIKHQKVSESRQQLVEPDTPMRDVKLTPSELKLQHCTSELELKTKSKPIQETGTLDELAQMNPLQPYVDSRTWLQSLCRLLRVCLSLIAIMISVDKTISTIVLCLISRPDIKSRPGNIGLAYEASDVTMSWLVLILINLSSMYILFSTVFNGHLLWELLGQRLFLVSRRFQYSTMLSMLVFIYLEYIVNISFINNLFGWSFETNDAGPGLPPAAGVNLHPAGSLASGGVGGGRGTNHSLRDARMPRQKGMSTYNIHNSYSVLANLETFVTEKDEANKWLDILLTCFQFARGIIRVSPYITITYVTICLNEHIKTIRNQNLLTDSLKKKQKLRMVVKSRRANAIGNAANAAAAAAAQRQQQGGRSNTRTASAVLRARDTNSSGNSAAVASAAGRKKRVIFVTEASGTGGGGGSSALSLSDAASSNSPRPPLVASLEVGASAGGRGRATPSPISMAGSSRCASSMSDWDSSIQSLGGGGTISPAPASSTGEGGGGGGGGGGAHHFRNSPRQRLYSMDDDCESGASSLTTTTTRNKATGRQRYLSRIKNFDELEAYITNLYIFTGRLNRLMSRQGLAMFFIVHNLVITSTLIVPEAISGGAPMAATIRILVVLIGIVPFIAGQALNGQLGQLSKQIDRIIIQQQFIGRKRDNLVRIRELLHDIRVNCGGMLNFNVETGIKYLVVAFASAFFIEQEDYKLTRRH